MSESTGNVGTLRWQVNVLALALEHNANCDSSTDNNSNTEQRYDNDASTRNEYVATMEILDNKGGAIQNLEKAEDNNYQKVVFAMDKDGYTKIDSKGKPMWTRVMILECGNLFVDAI